MGLLIEEEGPELGQRLPGYVLYSSSRYRHREPIYYSSLFYFYTPRRRILSIPLSQKILYFYTNRYIRVVL